MSDQELMIIVMIATFGAGALIGLMIGLCVMWEGPPPWMTRRVKKQNSPAQPSEGSAAASGSE